MIKEKEERSASLICEVNMLLIFKLGKDIIKKGNCRIIFLWI